MQSPEKQPTDSTLAPGQPGYRNQPGRSGLDPLENRQELGYMVGLAIRGLLRHLQRWRGKR